MSKLRPETVDLRTLFGLLKRDRKPISVGQLNRDIADVVSEPHVSNGNDDRSRHGRLRPLRGPRPNKPSRSR
jgi:hypothetical protein